jgi:hypothetical protein
MFELIIAVIVIFCQIMYAEAILFVRSTSILFYARCKDNLSIFTNNEKLYELLKI